MYQKKMICHLKNFGKIRNLQPKNFNIEICLSLRDVGLLHHSDGLINEILEFDSNLRIGTDPQRLVTKDVNTSLV